MDWWPTPLLTTWPSCTGSRNGTFLVMLKGASGSSTLLQAIISLSPGNTSFRSHTPSSLRVLEEGKPCSADHLAKLLWVPLRDLFLCHDDGSNRLLLPLSEVYSSSHANTFFKVHTPPSLRVLEDGKPYALVGFSRNLVREWLCSYLMVICSIPCPIHIAGDPWSDGSGRV